jgi:hypothetical protein
VVRIPVKIAVLFAARNSAYPTVMTKSGAT